MGKNVFKDDTYRIFLINISIVITLIITGIFAGLLIRNNELVNNELIARGRASFSDIVLARRWNAGYGGVYVEKKEGVVSNPYLTDPDITTTDGKVYTMKNPALMTREISEIADKNGMFTFHMTSLDPLNPDNIPDEFEREALKSFESGKDEVYKKEVIGGKANFRYMAPLYVEETCIECHADQDYKFGDIRGGISIKYNIDETEKLLKQNNLIIIALGVIIMALLLGIIRFLVYELMKKHRIAQSKIKEMAITDALTGLHNRRYLFLHLGDEVKRAERFERPLGCIMIDIDNFKNVNDTYGHHAGDIVLKMVSETIKLNCREIDMLARYGGEEIVILSPELNLEGLRKFAERVRKEIEDLRIEIGGERAIKVTISLGLVSLTSGQIKGLANDEDIIKFADSAMYMAKNTGKNRIEAYIAPNSNGSS